VSWKTFDQHTDASSQANRQYSPWVELTSEFSLLPESLLSLLLHGLGNPLQFLLLVFVVLGHGAHLHDRLGHWQSCRCRLRNQTTCHLVCWWKHVCQALRQSFALSLSIENLIYVVVSQLSGPHSKHILHELVKSYLFFNIFFINSLLSLLCWLLRLLAGLLAVDDKLALLPCIVLAWISKKEDGFVLVDYFRHWMVVSSWFHFFAGFLFNFLGCSFLK